MSIRSSIRRLTLCSMMTGLPLVLAACATGLEVPTEDLGQVAFALKVADSVELVTVSYEISGNGFSKTGTADVAKSKTLKLQIGGIPAGSGYQVRLDAAGGPDSGVTCSGSAGFDITPSKTTQRNVHLQCKLPKNGSLLATGEFNVCPTVDELTVLPAEIEVGGTIELSAVASDLDGVPGSLSYQWVADGGELANTDAAVTSLTCLEAGDVNVTLAASDSDCDDVVLTTVTCSPADGSGGGEEPALVWNEVESSGGTPGDWAELYNAGLNTADLSGYTFKDNDDTHAYVLPVGSTIAPGGYLLIEEAAMGFGLGGADSVRLFDLEGALVVEYTWTAHAASTYGRCPNASGEFGVTTQATKGSVNACPTDPNVAAPWPGSAEVLPVDAINAFPTNLSGLHYEPGSVPVLWAALNAPSKVYKLVWNGAEWAPEAGEWATGKLLNYPGGVGQPDTEGVTKAEWGSVGIYTATERNNEASSTSRLAVLRFDETASGSTLVATNEWNLTAQLPVAGANLGFETITWVPDSYLVASGFRDALLGEAYDPADYPDHGAGLFVLGVEGTGILHVVALDHVTDEAHVLSTVPSGHIGVMSLEFDRDSQALWAGCDDTCGNEATVLAVDQTDGSPTLGQFVVKARFDFPAGLPNSNNEGFAMASEAECSGGMKSVFWADDANSGTHALRQGFVNCGPLF